MIQQPPITADLLRIYQGPGGTLLFLLSLLSLAIVLASVLSLGRFMITKAPYVTPKSLVDEALREKGLKAINCPRPWQEPAAKHYKAATMHDHRSIVASLQERSAR